MSIYTRLVLCVQWYSSKQEIRQLNTTQLPEHTYTHLYTCCLAQLACLRFLYSTQILRQRMTDNRLTQSYSSSQRTKQTEQRFHRKGVFDDCQALQRNAATDVDLKWNQPSTPTFQRRILDGQSGSINVGQFSSKCPRTKQRLHT